MDVYSRPGTDPFDGGPFTTKRLLLGRATNNIPSLIFTIFSNTNRIRFLQTVIDEFSDKWRKVVFHSLVPQYKWHKSQRNICIDDVVLISEENALVSDYKLGQVVGVKTSKDGLVRSARVRCMNKTEDKLTSVFLDRPIHKLCVIVPVEEQE